MDEYGKDLSKCIRTILCSTSDKHLRTCSNMLNNFSTKHGGTNRLLESVYLLQCMIVVQSKFIINPTGSA